MNRQEADVLYELFQKPFRNQRVLAEVSGYSLGTVNRSLKNLINQGLLDEQMRPTQSAYTELNSKSPKNAIILAAGLGMRMVPINVQVSKALLEINKEPLIERTIRQLHEAGVMEIYVVAGFMKEQLEYLMDEYGVEMIVNEEYATKNNLHSLSLASSHISNTYIIPCDIWCEKNPYRKEELYSWYMVSDRKVHNSSVRVNRKLELVLADEKSEGNEMVGIAYITSDIRDEVCDRLKKYDQDEKYNTSFWEEILTDPGRRMIQSKVVPAESVVEINTYEQLREIDEESDHLQSDAIRAIERNLLVSQKEITNIEVLKKGMTNRSFLFTCGSKKYIMRLPGEGTAQLINRKEEADVYRVIEGKGICDDVIYIDPDKGYKISRFLEHSRVCDPTNNEDLITCMKKLRKFHYMGLNVQHEFDIFAKIDFYESLWYGNPSIYRDYEKTKEHVLQLKKYIDQSVDARCLTHMDAVFDNFLFTEEGEVRLIDWEYAGMQDPHVDIAMFCIYALYDKSHVDNLIDIYFEGNCSRKNRLKIYCYIASCGLLWSNWCEYKRNLGVEFGEYSLRQYRYAKDYYKIFMEEYNA